MNLLPIIIPMLVKALANPATVALIMQFFSSLGQTNTAPSQGGDAPEPLLRYDVKWLQESLNTLLGETNPVTGKMNDATRAAILKFQKQHPELVADGWAGLNTTVRIVAELEAKK